MLFRSDAKELARKQVCEAVAAGGFGMREVGKTGQGSGSAWFDQARLIRSIWPDIRAERRITETVLRVLVIYEFCSRIIEQERGGRAVGQQGRWRDICFIQYREVCGADKRNLVRMRTMKSSSIEISLRLVFRV